MDEVGGKGEEQGSKFGFWGVCIICWKDKKKRRGIREDGGTEARRGEMRLVRMGRDG